MHIYLDAPRRDARSHLESEPASDRADGTFQNMESHDLWGEEGHLNHSRDRHGDGSTTPIMA